MTLYPDVQQRAQAEINMVLGPGSIPTLDDRPRLPYVEAVFLEVLRWGQVSPVGIPHMSQADDIHRGYFIPKGTLVIPNIWFAAFFPSSFGRFC
jgi:cytochrome P450